MTSLLTNSLHAQQCTFLNSAGISLSHKFVNHIFLFTHTWNQAPFIWKTLMAWNFICNHNFYLYCNTLPPKDYWSEVLTKSLFLAATKILSPFLDQEQHFTKTSTSSGCSSAFLKKSLISILFSSFPERASQSCNKQEIDTISFCWCRYRIQQERAPNYFLKKGQGITYIKSPLLLFPVNK